MQSKRKWVYAILFVVATLLAGGGIVYKFYLPSIIAKTLATEALPTFVPQRIRTKIAKINRPLNETARNMISTIHHSGITLDQLLKAIDEAREEQAYAMLDELNKTRITEIDELFDMGKRYFPVDFDVEVFREPFRKKVTVPLIEKAIIYANKYRDEKLIDAQTAKETIKKILIAKETEFNSVVNKGN